jgi:3-hydroxyisobutyrate dehydrogenase-like beta-hydroxyacid dehydrogenase
MTDLSVGIVGLDSLGAALTRRLDQQGVGHTASDLNGRLLQAHLAAGGTAPAGSPLDLAQMCNLILITETTDEGLREVVHGSIGVAHKLRPGTIIVDMSDVSPETGPALARSLYSKGVTWIEATPIGTPQDVRDGKLALLMSGPDPAIQRATPVLRAFTSTTLRLGEIGSGPLAKSLVAVLGILSVAVYTEMLIVAKKAGVDVEGILGALPLIAPGIGTPPAAVAALVLTGRYQSGVATRRMQDDMARVLGVARQNAAPAPFAALVQAALTSSANSPATTGDYMDVARWMADNANVQWGPDGKA